MSNSDPRKVWEEVDVVSLLEEVRMIPSQAALQLNVSLITIIRWSRRRRMPQGLAERLRRIARGVGVTNSGLREITIVVSEKVTDNDWASSFARKLVEYRPQHISEVVVRGPAGVEFSIKPESS